MLRAVVLVWCLLVLAAAQDNLDIAQLKLLVVNSTQAIGLSIGDNVKIADKVRYRVSEYSGTHGILLEDDKSNLPYSVQLHDGQTRWFMKHEITKEMHEATDTDVIGRPLPQSNSDFAFVHIPKTGGTFLESVLIKNYSGKMMANYSGKLQRLGSFPECSWPHTPPQFWETSPWLGRTQFTIVRHPYDRFISDFKYLCHYDTTPKPYTESPSLIYDFHQFSDGRECSDSAVQLNEFARKALRRCSQANVDGLRFNCHFLPQSYYTKTIAPQYVFCNATDLRSFGEKVGVNFSNFVDLPKKNHNSLDEDAKLILQEVYKEDFQLCDFKM